ncbi:MAG: hypothetical protein WCF57_17400 [Pyrinomonadaceae bacterium]
MNERIKIEWRWGAIAAVAMAVLAFYPQLHFWMTTEGSWESGAYAHLEGVGDEVAYSAYVNALIEGRPRRNDPYTGHDDRHEQPQPESLFSVQCVPAYMIALPARALGLRASSAFMALMLVAALSASLAIFWLLATLTGDSRLACAGAIVVLCLGTLAGGHGHVVSLFGQKPLYNYLMFLRRYQPSATFPFFFALCVMVWRAVTCAGRGAALSWAIAAGTSFGLLVFSYFYLWTAAAAWLACVALSWVAVRPGGWRRDVKLFGLIAGMAMTALVPYAVLLSRRATTMDEAQALTISHAPDLLRLPELIALVILAALGYGLYRGALRLREKALLFTASFALMPFVVFNQQVLTGRSLQPLHYEMFIANYSALVALVLATALIWKGRAGAERIFPKRALAWVAIAAFEWGAYEAHVAAMGSREFNRQLADAQPVAARLVQLAQSETRNNARPTVLSTDLFVADCLPESAPQAMLWAPHMLVFSGATAVESKERLFQYLYFTGVEPEEIERFFDDGAYYGVALGLFGFDRVIDGLSAHREPITRSEVDEQARLYALYVASFDRERAAQTALSYVITPSEGEANLKNLDRWYERDGGERVGAHKLYRVRLR